MNDSAASVYQQSAARGASPVGMVVALYDTLLKETSKRRLIACIHNGSPVNAAEMNKRGFHLVTVASDITCMAASARESVLATRRAVGPNAD